MPPVIREQRAHRRPSRLLRISRDDLAALIGSRKPLTDLDLSRCELNGTDLRRRNLAGSDLSGANLVGANLERARLAGCNFAGADLHGARLVEADLRRADLSAANGLTADQLRGALLASAKLPDGLVFDGLDRVRDLVNRAERQLQVLLLACASVGIVSWGSGHAQFFLATSPLTLPGLEVPVALSAFFVLAPVVLFGLFTNLSFSLRKLWLELASLPAQFANERGLHEQTAPSSPAFTAPAATHLARRIHGYNPSPAERRLMVALVWWATPAAMVLLLWLAYLPRHSGWISGWHVLWAVATAAWGVASYRQMDFILSGRFRRPRGVPGRMEGVQRRNGGGGAVLVGRIIRVANAAAPRDRGAGAAPPRRPPVRRPPHRRPRPAVPGILGLVLVMAVVSYLAIRAPGCAPGPAQTAEKPSRCNLFAARLGHATLNDLSLPYGNLRRAFLYSAEMRRVQMERADLQHANLIAADLSGANLKDAELHFAVLWEARLDGARVKEAKMKHADLRGASLRLAQLQGADFTGANLRGVDWRGAIVCGAVLTGAEVDTAALKKAYGWQRVVRDGFGGGEDKMDEFEGRRYPAYLDATQREEYFKWERAWKAASLLPADTGRAEAVQDTAALIAAVARVDVSMGASRQREQEQILAAIRAGARERGDGRIELTPGLRRQINHFREEVRKKASNHCVAVLNE